MILLDLFPERAIFRPLLFSLMLYLLF